MRNRFWAAAFAVVIGTLPAAAENRYISDVSVFDPQLEVAIGCQRRVDVFYHEGMFESAKQKFQSSGVPVDPAIFDRLAEDGCVAAAEGSHGDLYIDPQGDPVVDLRTLVRIDGSNASDLGLLYFRLKALRNSDGVMIDVPY